MHRPNTPQGTERSYSSQSTSYPNAHASGSGSGTQPRRSGLPPTPGQPGPNSAAGGQRPYHQQDQHLGPIITGHYSGVPISVYGQGPHSASAALGSSAAQRALAFDAPTDRQPVRASTSPATISLDAGGHPSTGRRGSLQHEGASHLRVVTSTLASSSNRYPSERASPSPTNMADPYHVPLPPSEGSHSRHDHNSSATSHQHYTGGGPPTFPVHDDAIPSSGGRGAFGAVPAPMGRPHHPHGQDQYAGSSSRLGAPAPIAGSMCGACGKPVKGQFVRAMNKVFHLNCFRCRDCNIIVAAKFFPVEDTDESYPLCERDYFARLDLICGKCDKALRGSYITACSKKYHVEHFTCSVCPVVFGPSDSYYEHGDEVYCHFHYSTRFAVKCVGCANAILKQFVEINRNQKDECWHPECYMIHKFWNVKLTSKLPTTPTASTYASTASSFVDVDAVDEEKTETPDSLRAKQARMERQVEQIWRVLSAFEESSAGCISEMLRFVSAGQYLDAVIMAERFILHVEVLFAAIDDLEAQFAAENVRGMSHAREAKMLCRKTVNFFSLLSHTQDPPEQRASITQELLALVTGLAHYLKILIRIALTGSLKLEREHGNTGALDYLLARLSLLALDDADPSIPIRGHGRPRAEAQAQVSIPPGFTSSTCGVAYGYRSLALEVTGESVLKGPSANIGQGLDSCMACRRSVEEDCVRLGVLPRWHSYCLKCKRCDRPAGLPPVKEDKSGEDGKPKAPVRRPPPLVEEFVYERGKSSGPGDSILTTGCVVYCTLHGTPDCAHGFEAVSRLEQYAFLLNVALRRLYDHLRAQGVVVEALPLVNADGSSLYGAYRDSTEIKRLKSVHLDRKLSATARTPQRSTVVESPSGRIANTDGSGRESRNADVSSVREDSPRSSPEPYNIAQRSRNGDRSAPPSLNGGSHRGTLKDGSSTPTSAAGQLAIIRPAFARNNTSVCIINDDNDTQFVDQSPPSGKERQTESAFADDEGVTLADIPALVEAEQARMERGRTPRRDGRPLLSGLSVLESLIIKHFALLALQRSPLAPLIDVDELLELMEVKKNGWWNKIFKTGKDKKDLKRKGVFGVPLEILVEKTGSDSQLGASNTQLRVPEFVDNVISAMKQMDMSVVGIFRKNGNIKRLNSMVEALDRDISSVNLSDDNPVQLAALLKRFLRELPDPLMTFKLHRLWCAAQILPNEAERHRCLHLLVCLLPRYNRDTMEVLFVFLKWVASFSHVDEETGSRMDVQNLATVICPSILYARGSNAMKDDSFTAIKAIQSLVDGQDEFYTVPPELQFVLDENVSGLFANSVDLPPKEILKHCSNYHTARHAPPQTMPRIPAFSAGGRTDPAMGSYRSEGNLSNSGASQLISRTATPSRPSSWVEVNAGNGYFQPHPHQPHSAMSAASSPGGGPRRPYPAPGPDYGGRMSVPSSPAISFEADRRPSGDLDRVRSPLHLDDHR